MFDLCYLLCICLWFYIYVSMRFTNYLFNIFCRTSSFWWESPLVTSMCLKLPSLKEIGKIPSTWHLKSKSKSTSPPKLLNTSLYILLLLFLKYFELHLKYYILNQKKTSILLQTLRRLCTSPNNSTVRHFTVLLNNTSWSLFKIRILERKTVST